MLLKSERILAGRKAILLIAVVVLLVLLPYIVQSRYLLHIIIMTYINALLAMNFSLLYSAGLITLGAAGFWALGAYASSVLVMKVGLSFWLSLPLAGLIASIIALGFGCMIVRTPGFVFVMETFVINLIIVHTFGHIPQLGGWGGIRSIPRPDTMEMPFLGQVAFQGKVPYYYLALFLLLLTAVIYMALYSSRIGTAWKSIRHNPRLGESLGIDSFKYRVLAFCIGSGFCGLAGSFYAHYFETIEPGSFTVFKSLYIQVYSILGGLDFYLLGPVVGAAIMTFLPEFLRITEELEPILTGAVLILLVIFLPGGILSIWQRIALLWQKTK
jgi:branched-chain amino acid transport system permease protein